MNKRGFAISIILYSMVFLLISIFYLLLSIVKNRYTVNLNLKNDIIEELSTVKYFADRIKILGDNAGITYVANYDNVINNNSGFTTQDQVSTSATKNTIYYYTGEDAAANGNVLFAGYCWQIVRTTDNGGVRLVYNGVAVDNKCEKTREATKGINGQSGTTQNMTSASLYGRSYDYDLSTGEFTIEDSTGLPTSWTTSDNNSNGKEDYKELIGTYTCLSNLTTCSTLYYVGGINQNNNAQAYVAKYTIGDIAHYSQVGTSAFNSKYTNLAMVGYMFNTEYDYKQGFKSGEYYTNAVWENGAYTLTNGNGNTIPDATHHYICDTDCTKVRYYYYSTSYYILLENGLTVEDAVYQMTGYGSTETKTKTVNANYKLNNYNSAMKGYLDNWYAKNLTEYTSYLDDASVYCNDRNIRDLAGFNPNGTNLTGYSLYNLSNTSGNLNCAIETDRFAVTNSKAKLSYPVGLLTEPERNLMTANYARTGQVHWIASPTYFFAGFAQVRCVAPSGIDVDNQANVSLGIRPVVTLIPGTEITSGTGTYDNPYIVGPIVTRTES